MTKQGFRTILATAPIAWVIALISAAYVASRPTIGVAAYAFSAAVYSVGALVCHQLPARSFHLWGAQLAVCARCAGLYAGAAVVAAAALRGTSALDRQAWTHARALVAAAALPTALTLAYEWSSGRMPSHAVRAVAGFVLGSVVMAVLLGAASSKSAVGIH